MKEEDILFSSIISSLAQSFLSYFGITISEPQVPYEPAELKEKRIKKEDSRKSFDRTNQLRIRTI